MTGVRRGLLIGTGVVLAVVAVLLISLVVTVRRPLPEYSGSVEVPGIAADVTILRDAQGVAQIYADNAPDLFYAQGYVHASDRFFQMDVRRHITAGRLSELVGDNATALMSDKLVRTLGWREVAEQELPLLSTSTRNNLQSYADGVNAYLESRSPGELSAGYVVLGTEVDLARIEPWTPVDSLAWLKAASWNLKSNYDSELGRAISFGSLGNVALVNELYPAYPLDHPTILTSDPRRSTAGAPARGGSGAAARVPVEPTASAEQATALADTAGFEALAAALDSIGGEGNPADLGAGVGSNAWVVSGEYTESGEALVAADPHLQASMPGNWYQSGLHCREVTGECPYQVAGIGYAGVPGIVMGHNSDVAWGLANLPADTTDLFLERVIGDTVVVDGVNQPLTTREETIRVAGADDVRITVRSTGHGPIVSDVLSAAKRAGAVQPGVDGAPIQGDYDVSLAWTGLTPGRTMDALFGMNAATDATSFHSALQSFDGAPMNVVYGTSDGIGYQAVGQVPVRQSGNGLGQSDGTWPREGWNSAWNWTGVHGTGELPGEQDPDAGFFVAANNKVSPGSTLTSDWDHGDRAARITRRLTELTDRGGLSASDMSDLQNDTYDAFAHDVVVPQLLATPPSDEQNTSAQRAFTAEAVDLLRDWDGRQDVDSAAAAYYNAVWASLLRRTFADQLPSGVEPDGDARTNEIMRALLAQQNSTWWDDVSTPTIVETRDQIVAASLVEARLTLTAKLGKDPTKWRWGQLHLLTPQPEPLGAGDYPGWAHQLMDGDTVQLGGSTTTVNAIGWDASSESFAVTTVPSHRYVVDLGDLDGSTWVDRTGVSGHPWSRHYGDQTASWAAGETYPWPFTREAVEQAADDTLTLTPAPSAGS